MYQVEDLGLPNSDLTLMKYNLSFKIGSIAREKSLSAEMVAELLNIPVDKVLNIFTGNLKPFSMTELFDYYYKINKSSIGFTYKRFLRKMYWRLKGV